MSEAKKCDRCGRFYEERDNTIFENFVSALSNSLGYQETLPPLMCELCKECKESMKKWWKGANKNFSVESHPLDATSRSSEDERRYRMNEDNRYQKECPFCHSICENFKGGNLFCKCNAKYYYDDRVWLDRNTGKEIWDNEQRKAD